MEMLELTTFVKLEKRSTSFISLLFSILILLLEKTLREWEIFISTFPRIYTPIFLSSWFFWD